jgi:malonyl-CoA/methylmalonyl-CoA synthetase
MICSTAFIKLAGQVKNDFDPGRQFTILSSSQFCMTPLVDPRSLTFCSGRTPDQNKPALIIFTSGSTGPPKGAAIRRYNIYMGAFSVIKKNGISRGSKTLQLLPTHHGTGLMVNTIPTILGGGSLEFHQGQFDPAAVWERFRGGDVTCFSAVPTMFVLLLRHWENVLSKLPAVERETY